MAIQEDLTTHLEKIGTAPFLFVGSGLSRRYIGLEDWESLLRKFTQTAALPNKFEYYKAKANGKLPETAKLLAEEFFDMWWKDAKYEASRGAFQAHATDRSSCMKFEISQYIGCKKYAAGADAQTDKEIELLKKATIDGIITTNWDTVLESLFPDFEVYIGQEQVLFSNPQGVAEIYKIHGCITKPNSLVLTDADYADFNSRNSYLAAKLLTVFVEHPVIFLGYSLADEDIRDILRQIAQCLTNDNIKQLQDRLIFVQRDSHNKGDSFESSVLQIDKHTLPVTIVRTNDYGKVYEPLGTFRRRFPARLLRQMKEHVYDLVRANDPKKKLAVIDIDDAENFDDIEVVYGVGVLPKVGATGYTPISRIDLFKDVMAETSRYDPKRIVEETLPLFKQAKYVPCFRYLREGGYIAGDGKIDASKLKGRLAKAPDQKHTDFYPPAQYQGELKEVQKCPNILGVQMRYSNNSFYYIPMLKKEQIDVEDLRKYVLANMNLLNASNGATATYFGKLICFYDWLKYRGV